MRRGGPRVRRDRRRDRSRRNPIIAVDIIARASETAIIAVIVYCRYVLHQISRPECARATSRIRVPRSRTRCNLIFFHTLARVAIISHLIAAYR